MPDWNQTVTHRDPILYTLVEAKRWTYSRTDFQSRLSR
jgi:hypothetical protein